MLVQIVFSILIILILLLAYSHINKKSLVLFTFGSNIFNSTKLKGSNMYVVNLMTHIKSPTTYKYTLNILLVTLIVAYILYNNIFFAVVLSGSMMPTAERGDMILMQTYNVTPKVGDIVMFRHEKVGTDEIITHRVYDISERGMRTKGDATPVDPWITPERYIISKAIIVGKQPIVIKDVGYYFLDETPTTTFSGEFGFIQTILMKSKELGLLIFAVCFVAFTLLSVNDSIKQKKLRNRRLI